MAFFSLGRSGFRDIKHISNALERSLKKFPGLWIKALHDAGDIVHKYFDIQFKKSGTEFGSKWEKLSEATQINRRRKGYKPAGPILVRRGWLRASVASKTSANAKRVVNRKGIVMYSTLKTKSGLNMLALHHGGGKYLPKRKIYKEGDPPFISARGWKEIKIRFIGMFVEVRREMEKK